MLMSMLAVVTGAALGALCRWSLGLVMNAWYPALPPGTLVANVVGGYLAGRAGLIRDDVLSFDLRFGFGAGTGPRILSPDLVAERDVTLWGQLGLELGAQLGGFGMHFAVVAEQFAVVSALIGVDFGL